MASSVAQLKPENQQQVQKFLEDILQRTRLPGISVAMSVNGDTLEAAAGVSSALSNHPMSPKIHFELGCINKLLVAIVALELVQEGRMDLDQTIPCYLPELAGINADQITIRHLLSHTAGYQGENMADPDVAYDYSWEEFVQSFNQRPMMFEPGTMFDYSHSSTVVLVKVIESVTARRIQEWFKDLVFKPLGVSSISGVHASSSLCAHGHLLDSTTSRLQASSPIGWCGFWSGSLGEPWITMRDLVKIGAGLMRDSSVFSAECKEHLMSETIRLPGLFVGGKAEQAFFAFGLGCARYPTGCFGARSSSRGQCLALRFDPDTGIVIAVGINAEAAHIRDITITKLFNSMLAEDKSVLPVLSPTPLTQLSLEELVGTYQGAKNESISMLLNDGSLELKRGHNPGVFQDSEAGLKVLEMKDKGNIKPAASTLAFSFGAIKDNASGSLNLMVGERFYKRVQGNSH